eukprot:CAMPEP_0118931002 /NCGR_PEP_ID=MMETSP1169-20130426/7497_1 /TAXON_ID=36882 /ORGANISM="Pyramimonas obovata, Strain CCMP722" /LENGTH=295 /DNA_ID=CAMNT_0006873447 /DNA_START=31 /DNA_END=915 /DNA_ORIENTATION=+
MVGNENGHYEEIAAGYEDAFFYAAGAYQDHLLEKVSLHLRFNGRPGPKKLRFVDLGGGTGNFTQALCDAHKLMRKAICVDPFQEMLDQATPYTSVETLCLGAVEFAQEENQVYDRVLLKEVVHHVPDAEVPGMYSGLFKQLTPGGIALTVTRPQEVDYPLFEAARQVWRENQPAADIYVKAMEAAGFCTEVVQHDYTVTIKKAAWLSMVRARFWSTFSHFTQEELDAGVAELEAQFQGQEELTFDDRLLFLVGTKPSLTPEQAGDLRSAFLRDGVRATVPQPNSHQGWPIRWKIR